MTLEEAGSEIEKLRRVIEHHNRLYYQEARQEISDQAFDALLRERFLGLTRRAIAGELDACGTEAAGGLALVLLLSHARAASKGPP